MDALIIFLYIILAACCLSVTAVLVMAVIMVAKAIKEMFDDDL